MKDAILITASTRGLGMETARLFLNNGHTVIINGRQTATLNSVFQNHENVYRFQKDMTDGDASQELLSFLDDNNLFVECVINNLGGKIKGDLHPVNIDIYNKTMRLNLTSAMEINNVLVERMKTNGGGKIFHIGSSSGYSGMAAPSYAISKGALNTYIKNFARFYAKDNIVICGIVPGILEHEGSFWDKKKNSEPERYNHHLTQMPLGRFLSPTEIAPVIYALYSTAGVAMTGSLIDITGGQ